MGWISNEQVEMALEQQKPLKITNEESVLICYSDEYNYCILERYHQAWETESGWRDSNSPPDNEQNGRKVFNFYAYDREDEYSSWFKMFVPSNLTIERIISEGEFYTIETSAGTIRSTFENIEEIMFDVISGDAETEEEIAKKFKLLGPISAK